MSKLNRRGLIGFIGGAVAAMTAAVSLPGQKAALASERVDTPKMPHALGNAIAAHQWFNPGDNRPGIWGPQCLVPEDGQDVRNALYVTVERLSRERPDTTLSEICPNCGLMMFDHGWLAHDAGFVLCPCDYIIATDQGYFYPMGQKLFERINPDGRLHVDWATVNRNVPTRPPQPIMTCVPVAPSLLTTRPDCPNTDAFRRDQNTPPVAIQEAMSAQLYYLHQVPSCEIDGRSTVLLGLELWPVHPATQHLKWLAAAMLRDVERHNGPGKVYGVTIIWHNRGSGGTVDPLDVHATLAYKFYFDAEARQPGERMPLYGEFIKLNDVRYRHAPQGNPLNHKRYNGRDVWEIGPTLPAFGPA